MPYKFYLSVDMYSFMLSEATAMPNSMLPQAYGNIL